MLIRIDDRFFNLLHDHGFKITKSDFMRVYHERKRERDLLRECRKSLNRFDVDPLVFLPDSELK